MIGARVSARATPGAGSARRLSGIATGLLLAMAAIFVIAHAFVPAYPVWSYVQAFAEAAMVGALADWFAVTALFRHPMGLPIPHTAIIPRNKDRIGDALAQFLRGNFLTPAVVARRMGKMDIAGALGAFLITPGELGGRLRHGASRLAADLLEALDQERLGALAKTALVQKIGAMDLAPSLGQALDAAMRDGRHGPVLDALIGWAGRALDGNEHLIREMVHERSGKILRWTGLDETLASAILDGLLKLIGEMRADSAHPVRLKAQQGLHDLAHRLQHDAAMRARVAAVRDEIVANRAMQDWIDSLWEQARAAMLRAARDPEAALAGRLGEVLRQGGVTILADAPLRRAINRFARRAAVGVTASYGASIVRLVSDTVRGWDPETVTSRIERTVGRDLQYIRINGTLVGGLVGLALHALERLL